MSDQGERGRDGATGAEGRAGTTGVPGATGETGHVGEVGVTGTAGAAGAAGAPGATGATGATGARGPTGGRNAAAAFLILMTFCFVGFVRVEEQTTKLDEQTAVIAKQAAASKALAVKTIKALRGGCEAFNVLRVNQALGASDQIKLTEASLRRPLGPLASFRKQIKTGIQQRKARLRELRESVSFPVTGVLAAQYPARERPFRTDCVEAFP